MQSSAPGSWLSHDADALRSAARSAGHSQAEFARVLVEEFNLEEEPSQPTVSRWWSGGTDPRPEIRPVLRRYIDAYGEERHTAASPPEADDARRWEEITRGLAGEPLLGPRQSRLVDTVLSRLAEGPVSAEELQMFSRLGVALGVFRDS